MDSLGTSLLALYRRLGARPLGRCRDSKNSPKSAACAPQAWSATGPRMFFTARGYERGVQVGIFLLLRPTGRRSHQFQVSTGWSVAARKHRRTRLLMASSKRIASPCLVGRQRRGGGLSCGERPKSLKRVPPFLSTHAGGVPPPAFAWACCPPPPKPFRVGQNRTVTRLSGYPPTAKTNPAALPGDFQWVWNEIDPNPAGFAFGEFSERTIWNHTVS